MKKLFTVGLFIMFAVCVFAQNTQDEQVRSVVAKFLELSRTLNAKEAATIHIYKGKDENRSMKSFINPASDDELKLVHKNLKKYSSLLKISNTFEIASITKKSEDPLTYLVIISFPSNNLKLDIRLLVIKIADKYGVSEE